MDPDLRAPAGTDPPPAGARDRIPWFPRVFSFRRLEWASFVHSWIYVALLVCAYAEHSPQPATFVLGLSHGLMWIMMSLICIAATRWRVVPYWLAVCVCVLGGLGPFCGSTGFLYEVWRRRRVAPVTR